MAGAVAHVGQLLEADMPSGAVSGRLPVLGEGHGEAEDATGPVGLELEAQDVLAPSAIP